jgi:D-erythronate 2-dehydrogenase
MFHLSAAVSAECEADSTLGSGRTCAGLLRAAGAPDASWGGISPVNIPALTVTVAEMIAALERAAGPGLAALIDWVPDARVTGIIGRWPARFQPDRAAHLGLVADPDFDSIIAMYRAEKPA